MRKQPKTTGSLRQTPAHRRGPRDSDPGRGASPAGRSLSVARGALRLLLASATDSGRVDRGSGTRGFGIPGPGADSPLKKRGEQGNRELESDFPSDEHQLQCTGTRKAL